MTKEDNGVEYVIEETMAAVLGIDHDGKKQWYTDTREGWCEVGTGSGTLELNHEHFKPGTKIIVLEPVEE